MKIEGDRNMQESKTTGRKHILVVDDSPINLRMAEQILADTYEVSKVQSGEAALEFLEHCIPDLILLDLRLPGIDGREVLQRIKANPRLARIEVICMTAESDPETETQCLILGAADFVAKPFVPKVMRSRIDKTLELEGLRNDLERKLQAKSALVEKVTLNSIMAIANTIDAKDPYTAGHSARVARCADEMARRLGWEEKDIQNIHYVALLHDIGKIGVPDAVLNKPSRLSDEEAQLIRKHPTVGGEILKDIHMIEHVAEGALYHHERYDGKGYPNGLKGEEIPICARIIGIADAYDAMASNRVYRPHLTDEEVIEQLKKGKGRQFDPKLVDLLVQMLRDGFRSENVQSQYPEPESIAEESNLLLGRILNEYTAGVKTTSMVDPLTGLQNRAYAEDEIERLLQSSHTGTLLAVDIDNFKNINDTYGHIAGDDALRLFARTLRENTEETDIVSRIGGDEFIVFFTDVVVRPLITERTQTLFDALNESLQTAGYGQIASVSIGIAIYPFDGKTYEQLYNNADKSLYYVKRNGKNSFSFHSDEIHEDHQQATTTDLDHIRCMIEGDMEPIHGAFQVKYEEFGRIYNYISRGVRRNHQEVQILLFTLSTTATTCYTDIISDEAMTALGNAVAASLRMVDVGTRYSSVQYIVILMDTNIENGAMVAQRVIERFYKTYAKGDVSLSYDIQTMRPKPDAEQPVQAGEENASF